MTYLKFLTILGLVVPLTGIVECPQAYGILLVENSSQMENTESLKNIVAENSRVEKVATGFQFTEGAVWHPDGFLLFSDIPANTIYQWQEDKEATIFRRPSQNANGNAFDRQGRLISAQHGDRLLSRTEKDGKVITLVDRYEGKRLNSPNDLAIRSDGSIYFTDPPYGIDAKKEELGFYGVYRLSPDGNLTLLAKDMVRPNGIAFSPDQSKLYVSDSQENYIRVFDVNSDGTVSNGRVFAELKDPSKPGTPDGLKVDYKGNVYSPGAGGIWIFSAEGSLLGKIAVPEVVTNLAWGDRDRQTLYITASSSIYRIRCKIAGI
jgi:sugar lactone lactonase YvrE